MSYVTRSGQIALFVSFLEDPLLHVSIFLIQFLRLA